MQVDRPSVTEERLGEVESQMFDLFAQLGASDAAAGLPGPVLLSPRGEALMWPHPGKAAAGVCSQPTHGAGATARPCMGRDPSLGQACRSGQCSAEACCLIQLLSRT